jgi:hypothetical protein
MKVLMLDHKEFAGDVAEMIYERLRQEIPSIEIRLEKEYMPKKISANYDCYLLHLSSTDVDSIEDLRKENPSALIIGISNNCCVVPETPEILEGTLDAYMERAPSETNLDRLVKLIRSRT